MRASKYFTGMGIETIRAEYHRLAKMLHPDLHPELGQEPMKDLNAQYLLALEALNGTTYKGFDHEDHTYYYKADVEAETMEKVSEALAAGLPDHVVVELIGTWIWVTGTAKTDTAARDALKKMGFRWHSKRMAWYWRKFQYRTRYNAAIQMEDMRRAYGSRTFHRDDETAVAVA